MDTVNPENTRTDLIFDTTTADFSAQVLLRSAQVPVVVDFWAAWCGPCRMLAPVLEKAVTQMGGRVLLARVDTDAEPELAQRYQISGIPAVKAFRDGRQVDEFTGARDPRFVRAFLERLAPSEQAQILERAAQHLSRGEALRAEALLRQPGVAEVPELAATALLLLAEAVMAQGPGRFAEVVALLSAIDPRSNEADRAEHLQKRLSFYQAAAEIPEDRARALLKEQPGDPDARFALAAALALRGDPAGAMEELLALVSQDRRYRDDGARKALLLLFEQLGPGHALTQEYRRRLQVVL